jgi:ABC-type amino acid transport system permease subunit
VFGIAYLSNRGLCVPKFADTVTVVGAIILLVVLYRGVAALWRTWQNRQGTSSTLCIHAVTILTTLLAAAGLALLLPHLPAAFAIDTPVLGGLNFRGGFQIPPEFAALAAAIILYRSAYVGEIFRGGFLSVPRGQIEAAISLGLKPWMVLWKVRLPLALILIVPPLSSEYMIIVKVTSIGIVIGFADLFMVFVERCGADRAADRSHPRHASAISSTPRYP